MAVFFTGLLQNAYSSTGAIHFFFHAFHNRLNNTLTVAL